MEFSEEIQHQIIIHTITQEIIDEHNKNSDTKIPKQLLKQTHHIKDECQVKITDKSTVDGGTTIYIRYHLGHCYIRPYSLATPLSGGEETELAIANPQFIERAAQVVKKIVQNTQTRQHTEMLMILSGKFKEKPELLRGTKSQFVDPITGDSTP